MSNFWAYKELLKNQHADFIADVARFANELQEEFPDMTRTHALKEAERIIGYNGLGYTFKEEQQ